jgi:hypothetical protein
MNPYTLNISPKIIAPILGLAIGLAAITSSAQEVKRELWRWKDANGVIHFSDSPAPGAERTDLVITQPTAGNAVSSPAAPVETRPSPASPSVTYTQLEILQPANDASFFGTNATVEIRLRLEPTLANGDVLRLFLNGQPVETAGSSLSYSLQNLPRGTHTLTASVRSANNAERISSRPVTFHLKQTTVIPPNAVGPGVRPPPPRPTPKGG